MKNRSGQVAASAPLVFSSSISQPASSYSSCSFSLSCSPDTLATETRSANDGRSRFPLAAVKRLRRFVLSRMNLPASYLRLETAN